MRNETTNKSNERLSERSTSNTNVNDTRTSNDVNSSKSSKSKRSSATSRVNATDLNNCSR